MVATNGKRITRGWTCDHKKCFAFTSSTGASLDQSSMFKLETTFIQPSMLSKRIDSKTTPPSYPVYASFQFCLRSVLFC